MIQLHYYPSTAAMPVHILLEELGVPFELVLVDRTKGEHKSAAYLRMNPNGLIPILVDGDLVLYEAAAICLHLVDTHSHAALAPSVGGMERAHFYKWLIWMANTLQATLVPYFYPERWVNEGNTEAVSQVKWHAQHRAEALLQQLDNQLAKQSSAGREWLDGERYSALDPYAFTLCRWTRFFTGDASRPARDWPHIGSYLQRMLARTAVQRVLTSEKLLAPWV